MFLRKESYIYRGVQDSSFHMSTEKYRDGFFYNISEVGQFFSYAYMGTGSFIMFLR